MEDSSLKKLLIDTIKPHLGRDVELEVGNRIHTSRKSKFNKGYVYKKNAEIFLVNKKNSLQRKKKNSFLIN